jgi:hypothetical protein
MDNEQAQEKLFEFIRKCYPFQLLPFIQYEHPQTIAFILSQLEPQKASATIKELPNEVKGDVIRRIATMYHVSPEIGREVERVLLKKLSTLSSEDLLAPGGLENAVEILNHTDRTSRRQITIPDRQTEMQIINSNISATTASYLEEAAKKAVQDSVEAYKLYQKEQELQKKEKEEMDEQSSWERRLTPSGK